MKCFFIDSPFKPSSVKTKVEAFEAALSGTAAAMVDDEANDQQTAVLPQARVVIQRLSEEELSSAGVHGQSPQLPSKRGTFVKPIEEVDSARRNVPEPKVFGQPIDLLWKNFSLYFIYSPSRNLWLVKVWRRPRNWPCQLRNKIC